MKYDHIFCIYNKARICPLDEMGLCRSCLRLFPSPEELASRKRDQRELFEAL